MRVISLSEGSVKMGQTSEIGKKEHQAITTAINFLKGKILEIVPMLTNPTTRNFLMKFFDMVASDPSILNGFRNSLQAVNAGMMIDASATTVTMNSTTR